MIPIDEQIKPVAWKKRITANDYYLFHGERPSGEGYTPLYDSAALAQAREEGRIAGLREAAEMVEMTDLSKVADPSWKLFFADMFIQIAANIRAALNKNPPKEIDPNKWAFDRGLESY
jgi:hypothetical protein